MPMPRAMNHALSTSHYHYITYMLSRRLTPYPTYYMPHVIYSARLLDAMNHNLHDSVRYYNVTLCYATLSDIMRWTTQRTTAFRKGPSSESHSVAKRGDMMQGHARRLDRAWELWRELTGGSN